MYYFDNNVKDEPSLSPNENNSINNNNYDPSLYGQSFHPSSFHQQSHSLDDNFSFLNFDNNAAAPPPSSFLQGSAVGSLGHDSLLAQQLNDGIYDSPFTDNSQQHDDFFLPLQQQQQQQQQQHNSHQKQACSTGENSELFLSLTEQEQQAILMTEPNFLRQQHLLHDTKMKMEMEDHDYTHTPPMRSNLSAILGQPTTEPMTLSSSIPPSSHRAMSAMSPNDIFQSSSLSSSSHQQHSEMSHSVGLDNGQQQLQQQQPPYSTSASSIYATTVKRVSSSSNTKPRKEMNRRSQQGIGSRGNHRANPIPINAGSSNTSGAVTKHSSSVPTEIDHQRRFNELQARFRVNYARKSGVTSGNLATPSTSSSQSYQHSSGVSNGFGNLPSRDIVTGNNSASVFGSSVPTSLEKCFLEPVYGSTTAGDGSSGGSNNDTENETSRSSSNNNNNNSLKSSSTITTTTGVGIPKNNNTSSSTSMKHASSFPSRTMPIQIQRVQRANVSQPVDADQRQKRLDDQLIKANFDDITVSELKEMLRQRGKPATGKKAILLQRLVDERDLINAVRSGKLIHRHSQPPPPPILSSSLENKNSMEATYASSSPLLESPSSVPNSSMFLSSSPGSTTLSLNRSIANMHIGSPPSAMTSQQHLRRYSPYNAPMASSPRLGSSPKLQIQKQAYSSSMPANYLSSPPPPPLNDKDTMIPSSSFKDGIPLMTPSINSATTNTENKRSYQGWIGRQQKCYAPFTSSALATPDHYNDKDPFDTLAKDTANGNGQQQQQQQQHQQLYGDLYRSQQDDHGIKDETMEWMNQSLTGNPSLNGILQDLPEGVSIDQFMVWLNENEQFNVNMDPMKMDMTGMMPMDINKASYSDGPLYDDLPPGGPDYT